MAFKWTLLLTLSAACQLAWAQNLDLFDTYHEDSSAEFFLGIGPYHHRPHSDYVEAATGFAMTVGGSYNRHYFDVDIDLGFGGKCQKDIYQTRGIIYRGERIVNLGISSQYGRIIRRWDWMELIPFVLMGVKGYNGGEVFDEYYEEDSDDNYVAKAGFSLGIGICTDFIIINNKKGNFNQRLRVKPYACLSHYGHDMKYVPSFNIAVQWIFNGH